MAESHVLYRFYTATGQLLYVGITMNPAQRFKAHKGTKDWWGDVAGITIEHYETREDLAKAEWRAIQVERPMHNVVHTKKKKPKPDPWPDPPEPPDPAFSDEPAALQTTDEEIKNLFNMSADPVFNFASLFSTGRRETCYGWVTDEEYKKYAAVDKARWDAIRECPFCDNQGYRNMYVCNHVDNSPKDQTHLRLGPGGADG